MCEGKGCSSCFALRGALTAALDREPGRVPAFERVASGVGMTVEEAREHYTTVGDCLLAAFDEATDVICAKAEAAFDRPGAWPDRVRRAVAATLEEFVVHPGLRWLFFEELDGAPDAALSERRIAARERYARVVAGAHDGPADVPRVGFEFLVGAGYRAIREDMLRADAAGVAQAAARAHQLAALIDP